MPPSVAVTVLPFQGCAEAEVELACVAALCLISGVHRHFLRHPRCFGAHALKSSSHLAFSHSFCVVCRASEHVLAAGMVSPPWKRPRRRGAKWSSSGP